MAASTRWRVSSTTPELPLETRETVCEETPASRATSAMDGPRGLPRPLVPAAATASAAAKVFALFKTCPPDRMNPGLDVSP
ncbi:hypothetical protein GCM10009738_78430 [Kitasatospora viridis]